MKKIFLLVVFLLSFSVVQADGCDALLTREAAQFIKDIVTIVRIAVPILLIVLCSSDFVSIVTGQDEKVTKTAISRIIKRFICAAAFFFVPLILQLILGIDAVNNALNLVDDPTCGIDGDLDGYKSEEEIQKETEKRLEEERKKKEEEEKKKIENQYKDEEYHQSTITGIRYITYNQVDPRWKDIPYGSKTVGEEGCPVIASSVIISAHDPKATPAVVVKTNAHSYPHTSVEAYAGDSFTCTMSRPSKYKNMREFLADGHVAVIRIQGPNAGGSNKFVPGNHYMALIDYNEKKDLIFVGNAFGSSGYAKSGWFDASTVLTSIKHGHYCLVEQSLIDKHNGKTSSSSSDDKSLNLTSSFNEYSTNINYLGKYSLYIPKNATENMPLVVVMPSSPENYNVSKNIFKKLDLDDIPAFILVTHHLNNYSTGFDAIKANIDEVVDKYKIDKNKISITGFSSSGTYMYNVVTRNLNFFSAMVPISSGQSYNSSLIQENLDYFKKLPMKGYGEKGGKASYDDHGNQCTGYVTWYPATSMKNFFTSLGRIEDFTDVGNVCHSAVVDYVFRLDKNKDGKSDVLMWMISQTKK